MFSWVHLQSKAPDEIFFSFSQITSWVCEKFVCFLLGSIVRMVYSLLASAVSLWQVKTKPVVSNVRKSFSHVFLFVSFDNYTTLPHSVQQSVVPSRMYASNLTPEACFIKQVHHYPTPLSNLMEWCRIFLLYPRAQLQGKKTDDVKLLVPLLSATPFSPSSWIITSSLHFASKRRHFHLDWQCSWLVICSKLPVSWEWFHMYIWQLLFGLNSRWSCFFSDFVAYVFIAPCPCS